MIPRWSVLVALLATASVAMSAEPLVRNLSIRGLQLEATTTLIVDGDHLAGARLLLPFAARQELKPDSTEKRATFDVTPGGDVAPGYYNLRVATDRGVSAAVMIGVDKLPQKSIAPAIEQLPVALHGAVGGSNIVETKFAGKAGQAVTIEVEAQRLESKLRPVVHLYNARRRQIAWSWPTPSLYGDTRLETTLPEDGEYTVTLHDLEYGPPGPGHFRLRIGQWSYVDQVFPPVITKGQASPLELIGAVAPPRIDVAATSIPGNLPLALPPTTTWSGPRPFVEVSSHAELLEQVPPQEGSQQLPSGVAGVSGRLATPLEEDRYRLNPAPGTKLRLEVFAERYGSPLDAAIVVRNEKGDLLSRGEDSPGTVDPVLEYNVPPQVNVVLVGVVDAQGRGSPRGIYRLVVEPQGSAEPAEFRLTSPVGRLSLPQTGRGVMPVFIERRGYEGPIDLAGVSLPGGVRLEGAKIAEGTNGALMSVIREGGATEAAVASLVGRAADGREQPVVIVEPQAGRSRGPQINRIQPWLDSELAVALTTANAADFQIDWRDLPAEAGLIPGRKLALPIKLVRPMENLVVRLSLVTSQPAVLVNGQVDPNRTLRQEQPVELAANVNEGQVSVVVPAELPQATYQTTVQAELLTADKQSVVARAFAPIRDLPVRHQLVVELASPAKIDVPLDAKMGATVKLEGKIERREGFTGDVQLTLTGLPAGVRADAVNVKADAVDFALNVVFPANAQPGELKGLRLSANAADPQSGNARVKSREVPLTLVVQPPAVQP